MASPQNPGQPEQTTQLNQPNQPNQSGQPFQSVQPFQPVQPFQSGQPGQNFTLSYPPYCGVPSLNITVPSPEICVNCVAYKGKIKKLETELTNQNTKIDNMQKTMDKLSKSSKRLELIQCDYTDLCRMRVKLILGQIVYSVQQALYKLGKVDEQNQHESDTVEQILSNTQDASSIHLHEIQKIGVDKIDEAFKKLRKLR